ncbi:MAG: transposase [Clostridiales bacterium]|nr:transposase [Clostridiales bacterium]
MKIRKKNRLKYWNYGRNGAYFITICTEGKKKILSKIVGDGAFDVPKNILTDYGEIVDKYINSSNNINGISIDKYVIMPNHIHMIIIVENNETGTSRAPSPTNSLIAHTISTFKRFVNIEIGKNIFQRSFHDHIIRNEADYKNIWAYIDNNPLKWELDCFFC